MNIKIKIIAIINLIFCLNVLLADELISDCNELREKIQSDRKGSYFLVNDIDCSAISEFRTLGSFSGKLNGNNKTIANINLVDNNNANVGLFSSLINATVEKLTIENLTIKISNYYRVNGLSVGGLSGIVQNKSVLKNITLKNITLEYFENKDTRISYIGGLVGKVDAHSVCGSPQVSKIAVYNANISSNAYYIGGIAGELWGELTLTDLLVKDSNINARTTAMHTQTGGVIGHTGADGIPVILINLHAINTDIISGAGNSTGGVVGNLNAATLENSSSIGGSITTSQYSIYDSQGVGGLVGISKRSNIHNSFSVIDVTSTGGYRVGGLVGWMINGSLSNSYAKGQVSGEMWVGGLIGDLSYGAKVSNTYATGFVKNADYGKGGLVGWLNDPNTIISDSYWDIDNTGQTTSDGSDDNYGKTETEMKRQSTFKGWQFNGSNFIWAINPKINEGYPYLVDNKPQFRKAKF